LKLVILITKGLIRDQHTRRMAMFVIVLAALAMLFAGATFLSDWLRAAPWWFLIYWAACAWLTFCAVLMALFDLLLVRARARRVRKELQHEIFGAPPDDKKPQ
jgi:hypothetical protein